MLLRAAARQDVARDLFADPTLSYAQTVEFYQHDVDWVNRLIIGDSLQTMSGALMDWIDKNHLDTFAGRKDARRLLPALIYDLILATSETPVDARFLSGEAGQVRGFDGVLLSRGTDPFVPAGHPV